MSLFRLGAFYYFCCGTQEDLQKIVTNYDCYTQFPMTKEKKAILKKWPKVETLTNYNWNEKCQRHHDDAKRIIKKGFYNTTIIALIVLTIGFLKGDIHPSYRLNIGKTLTYFGSYLLLFSTYFGFLCSQFQYGQYYKFYKVVHNYVFIILLTLGSILTFLGVIS